MPALDLGQVVGDPGPGVASGGGIGDLLAKASTANYDTEWSTLAQIGAELVKPGNPVGAALSNKAWNHNLLHNWDFRNPINQRGQTTYTGLYASYCVDRWIGDGNYTIVVNDGYTSVTGHMYQITEIPYAAIAGRTMTVSLLRRDNTLLTVTGTFPAEETNLIIGGGAEAGLNINYGATSPGRLTCYIEPKMDGDDVIQNDIVAAKLEYGSQQTLARQDAAGNWVLNDPPPDPALELLRCQRYFQTFATQSLRPTQGRDFRPVMRTAAPTLGTITLADETVLYTASSDI